MDLRVLLGTTFALRHIEGYTRIKLAGKKKKSLLSGKIKGDIYWYDVSESKYGNQNALSSIIFNLLKPTGHVMHQQFNIQQLYVLPTLYLCVLYLSNNKQRLVPLTA